MASGFTCISASAARVDLDTLFKARTTTAIANTGFVVNGTDIAQRYEASADVADRIGFNTFFKKGASDLSSLFMDINYGYIIQYLLSVYSGSGSGLKNSGSYAPITASTAPTHYHFATWTGDTVVSPTSAQTTIYMNAAKVVSASYAKNQYVLTVTNGSGDGTFDYDATMPIVANAAPAYQIFNNWSNPVGDLTFDNSAASSTNAHFASDNNATAEAVYNWILYNVQATNGSGGSRTVLNGNDSGGVLQLANNDNQQYTLVAYPTTHYSFSNWTGNTGGIGNVNAASTYIIVTGNATVSSNFTINQYTLTVNGGTGGGTQNYGYIYTVNATIPAYKQFSSWSNAGNLFFNNPYSSITNPTQVYISANTSITGNYDWINYTVQAINGSGGASTILNGNSSGAPFTLTNNNNQAYTLKANADTNFQFSYWSYTGNAPASTTSADTTVIITGNNTLTSNFLPYPTIQAKNGSGGYNTTINNNGSGAVITIAPGTYSLVATPLTGYYFVTWVVEQGASPASMTAASTTITLPINTTNVVASTFAAYVLATSVTWADASGGTYPLGTSLSITVASHNGTPPVNYQWYYWNGTGYVTTGTNSATLYLGNSYPIGTPDNVGTGLFKYYYGVTLTNGAGTSSMFEWNVIVDTN